MNEQENALLELLLRVSALEKTLINKGVITEEEFKKELELVSEKIINQLKIGENNN